MLCVAGALPYALLILLNRPINVSPFLCKIFGFVNSMADKAAWFNITR